jgi:phage FluMu gp28-like protein
MTTAPTLKSRGDTLRLVEWDELPPSVKQIPHDLNPLNDGVLMKHQREYCAVQADLKVGEKGRRTGITFAEALDDVLIAAARRDAGGNNIYYVGDTKDKGLEFIGYCAHFARVIAQAQGMGISGIEEFLFEDQKPDGSTQNIAAYRIRFASGFTITALSSNPANIRGLQGIVVIDEAAFHKNVQAVIEAATALLIWGGKIRVISTHNKRSNAFNTLIDDIRKGRYGDSAKVYRATFDDAVKNGLYERVCLMTREKPTLEGKEKWYTKIRRLYGPRKAAMREELDAVPRDGGGASIPSIWIDRSMRQERPVLRLVLGDDFVKMSNAGREDYAAAWVLTHLKPALQLLHPARPTVFGMDFARHRNFTTMVPLQIEQNLSRTNPFAIELQNVPSRQQEQILWFFIRGLPMFRGGAMDATGPGLVMAEYTADEFGHDTIHQVTLSRQWYAEYMPKMVQRFEDDHYDLPRDANIEEDLRAVEENDGIPMVRKVNSADVKEPELFRHGDYAIGLALAEFAALNMCAPIEYMSGGPRESARDVSDFLHG